MFHNFFEHFEGGGGGGFHSHSQRQQDRKPVDTEGYYKFFNIAKDATPAQIKKAYRKLAMKHHPDRGGDPVKFKELNKIYEVLSTPDKRELYDKGGEEAVEKGEVGGGDPFDMFGGGRGGRKKKKKGQDVVGKLSVTLEDLYKGSSKPFVFRKQVLCDGCRGTGGKGVKQCGVCNGRGMRMTMRQIGPGMIQQIQSHCDACKGVGEIIPPGGRCRQCRGEKVVQKRKEVMVHINKGMKNGSKIKFREEADQKPDEIPGDLIVKLVLTEHKRFHREGAHLFYRKTISLCEALTGFEFTITTLENRTLIVQSLPDVLYNPGCVRAIRDEGMPKEDNPSIRGNLYIILNVRFPDELDDASVAALKKILPTNKRPKIQPGDDLEEVTMKLVDINKERKKWKQEKQHASQYDSDDEEECRGRGQTAQCHAQ